MLGGKASLILWKNWRDWEELVDWCCIYNIQWKNTYIITSN